MGEGFLSKIFRPAFQTELFAGRPESGIGRFVAPRRFTNAGGCLRFDLAERVGSINGLKTRFLSFLLSFAGITTFFFMTYILAMNPAVLFAAEMTAVAAVGGFAE